MTAVVLVAAPESVRQQVEAWRLRQGPAGERLPVVEVSCPARIDRESLASFWEACGRPRVLLRGDSAWTASGAAWLQSRGARVEVQGRATQLSLI